MFSNSLKISLKFLIGLGIMFNVLFTFYLLFLSQEAQFLLTDPIPSETILMIDSILGFSTQLFLAYSLYILFVFLQKNDYFYLKKFGILLIVYAILKILYGAISSVILSWHLGDGERVLDIDADEMTVMYIGIGLLMIYLSNLSTISKK